MNNLIRYGLSEPFVSNALNIPNLVLGRVISQYNNLYNVVTDETELIASVSGKYEYNSRQIEDFPVVGDFVMLDRSTNQDGNGIIHHTLPRKSSFKRKVAGTKSDVQIIATNIDIIFICMSINNDFNLRRLERYLSIAWDSGATPVVILTKSDLCESIYEVLEQTKTVALGVDILLTSSMDKSTCIQVSHYLKPGLTAAFIGSSGVGKSTLINNLAGHDTLATAKTRKDDKGKHTTTRRDLIILPHGGIVIDTPGMREIGAHTADLSKSFSDIDELIGTCKFSDCSHTNEPGCSILNSIKNGTLTTERYDSYKKLEAETLYNGLNARQIENEKINRLFGSKSEMKQKIKAVKNKKNPNY